MKRPEAFRDPRALAGVPDSTPLCIALSGGADSVALLAMLAGDPHLSAVHVHHGIRGDEADRDERFCRAVAAKYDVPITVLHIDAPALARERGVGLETAARDGRYAAILSHLRENRIPLLVTAHHADDQLETMLQHLLRGSGLNGLGGIPACRPLDAQTLVARPLLQIPKTALLSYLDALGQEYVTDSTNSEPCCTRNRLRAEVAPLLEALYPGGATAAARCALSLQEDERLLSELARDFLKKEGKTPSVAALNALPRPIFARVMQQLLPTAVEHQHIEAVAALCAKCTPHASLSLPGTRVAIENGRLCFPVDRTGAADYDVILHSGENQLPCGAAVLLLTDTDTPPTDTRHTFVVQIPLCSSKIKGTLRARNMRPGDRLFSCGVNRAVRRMAGSSVPASTRAQMPLLVDDAGVLAVPFGKNHNVRDDAYSKSDPDLIAYLLFD